jgi:hypothetical protein
MRFAEAMALRNLGLSSLNTFSYWQDKPYYVMIPSLSRAAYAFVLRGPI